MTVEAQSGQVYGGVDTHEESIHVAVISALGHDLGDKEFPTSPEGYQRTLAFITSHGDVAAVGIEGTSSYGVGIATAARAANIEVVEVMRPERAERRRLGKSDPIDAYQAARAALGSHRTAPAKDPAVIEGIRALHNARRSARKARTAAMIQIHHQLITAPTAIRERYRSMGREERIKVLARIQIRPDRESLERAIMLALKTLSQRCIELQREHDKLGIELDQLVTAANPGLRAAYGVGPDTGAQLLLTAGGNPERLRSEAAFAALCGTSPIQASSGKITRHRLSRGGDRTANSALHSIALVRMAKDPRTKDYVTKQRQAGLSSMEIIRKLKRAIAREVFRYLTTPVTVPAVDDLRPLRQAKNITLTTAANELGVWPITISELERGIRRNDNLAQTYRNWLHVA
ncbi:IS110 family transposase [Nocardioides sp. Kera G14]|uniref:IS110 family transposase n=1 Tax=Nocardioides sp. Kera G14 TaxID=2884264 RepID=UPI001D11EC6D|nr:IS110 family transposase [Nocardioides sp. Kera G14]UDY24118.1 IS110 family transposase [Nocardioides sp. Kera G14]